MIPCSCGRQFNSESALAQHQTDKVRIGGAASACQATLRCKPARTARSSPGHSWREAWMWKDVRDRNAIQIIDPATLELSSTTVSSVLDCELICSYNWKNCKEPRIHTPGHAPIWQDITLPVTLPKDAGTHFVDQNAARAPQHPFEPLFQATASMNPDFRFDDVDIVVNRNSLRKLLDLCGGRVTESFRVNLLQVQSSLFIERCEKSARKLVRGSQNSGWGRNFERAFTDFPLGLEDSTGHHRVLRYPLGNLNCVVRFEVDACYETRGEDRAEEPTHQTVHRADAESVTLMLDELSIGGSAQNAAARDQTTRTTGQARTPSQSTAAEIKTSVKPKPPGAYLPQLWFGRTPWLIIGYHTDGVFTEVKVTDAGARFIDWENKHQTKLLKLVSLLTELRKVVRKHGGGNCIAICEKGSPPAIKIFTSGVSQRALPDDLISKFWVSAGR